MKIGQIISGFCAGLVFASDVAQGYLKDWSESPGGSMLPIVSSTNMHPIGMSFRSKGDPKTAMSQIFVDNRTGMCFEPQGTGFCVSANTLSKHRHASTTHKHAAIRVTTSLDGQGRELRLGNDIAATLKPDPSWPGKYVLEIPNHQTSIASLRNLAKIIQGGKGGLTAQLKQMTGDNDDGITIEQVASMLLSPETEAHIANFEAHRQAHESAGHPYARRKDCWSCGIG